MEKNMNNKKRIIVGSSGASGMPLLIECLKIIKDNPDYESHLIMSKGAEITMGHECNIEMCDVLGLADYTYDESEIGAGPASGSFKTEGMVVVPCSMKTLSGIHSGYADTLLLRACDVTIKEHRNLVLCTRETPLSPIHLRNMQELSMIGNVWIIPPMMTFYIHPETIEEMTYHIAAKLLTPFGIEAHEYKRWTGKEIKTYD